MDKVKILIVAGEMGVGGIENQLMHLLRQADKEKFQIDFTTTADEPFYKEEMLTLGAKCIKLPKTNGKHFFKYCKALYRVLKDGKYDVVHSHELFHSGMVLLTARLAGVKHRFVHAHNWSDGTGDGKKRGLIRTIYNAVMRCLIVHNATDFCACSTLAGKFLYGEKVTKQKNYHLIFNSVDTSKFIEQYDREESGEFCDNWTNVIQVGRFTPVKNQLFTAEIAEEFKKRGEKIRILCAGNCGGEYNEKVKKSIAEKGIDDYMKLIGVRKDIDVLMRKSGAFLLPSLYEGMPLVLIEAQASGLPCVVADTFSREVDFGIGTVQWLKLENTASEWADAVESAIAQGRADKAKVVNAIETYGFDSKVFAKILCNLYEASVVNDKNPVFH